jgi:hypothetical protein
MELDLKNADTLVELLVAEHCATYGAVVSVEVHREPSPFALVEILRRDLCKEVSSHFKGGIFGSSAPIRSEHKDE